MDTQEVQGTVKEMEGAAEKGIGQLKDKVHDTFDEINPNDSLTFAKDLISQSPVMAIALAAGIGFVLGSLLTQRD